MGIFLLNVGSCETLDHHHRAAAIRAAPAAQGHTAGAAGSGSSRLSPEQLPAQRQPMSAMPIGQEAEEADADEAPRQRVQQEPAKELVGGERHLALLVLVGGVPPTEADLAVGERDQPMVGDRHPVRVGAQLADGVLRAAKGTLGIDDPLLPVERPEPSGERLGPSEELELTV